MSHNLSEVNDIDNQAEWLGKIKLNELSNQSLILISKLSREIRKANGSIIKLNNPSLIIELAQQVMQIDSPGLHKLYRSFLEEAMRKKDSDSPDTQTKIG